MNNYNKDYYNAAARYYCPKCNSKEHTAVYNKVDINWLPEKIKSEWINLTCKHCGFEWVMNPFNQRPDYNDLER